MKRIILIAAILIIAGGGYFAYQAKTKDTGGAQQENQRTGGLVVKDDDSLLGWLKRGKDVDCLVTTTEGEDIIVLAKGDKVRIDGTPNMFGPSADGTDWIMVTTDEWMYTWSGSVGTKINMSVFKDMADEMGVTDADQYAWENWAAGWEDAGATVKCQEARLSDNLFVPPASVEFTDMTAIYQGISQLGDSLPDLPGAPAGGINSGTMTEGVDLEVDLDEIMRAIEGM